MCGAGTGTSGGDDSLLFYWCCRHFCLGRDFWLTDLGSCRTLGRFNHPVIAFVALIALLIATLNTNVAANVVSPSNDFRTSTRVYFVSHRRFDYRRGGCVDDAVEIDGRFQRLYFRLAGGYSGLLGPIAGVMIADYFLVRKASLNLEDLYRRHGAYEYVNGFNLNALWALGAGIVVALIGLFVPSLRFPLSLCLVCRIHCFRCRSISP